MDYVLSDGSVLSVHATRVLLELVRETSDETWKRLTDQETDDEFTVWDYDEIKTHITEFAEEVCS